MEDPLRSFESEEDLNTCLRSFFVFKSGSVGFPIVSASALGLAAFVYLDVWAVVGQGDGPTKVAHRPRWDLRDVSEILETGKK